MTWETVEIVLRYLQQHQLSNLDITGGAPELNPHFRYLVEHARNIGVHVIDRCNLTILLDEQQEDLARFLAEKQVEIVASLPCYLESNVDSQRGKGTFQASIHALRELNALGYGKPSTELKLNLVYNPLGPSLPPSQQALELDYKRRLHEQFGISFNQLLTITNMPIQRFGSYLQSKGEFQNYLKLLRDAHQPSNLDMVMCRHLLSVDWRGYVYDCDFNQMLKMPLKNSKRKMTHLSELMQVGIEGRPIQVAEHCYGCTAGQGSSCSGALD
jgi:radical SAM/Cys-rich protein